MKNSIKDILNRLRDGKKVTEDELLLKLSDGNTVFEYAIKNHRIVNCDKFIKTKSLDIILENKKYEYLCDVDLKTLLKLNRKNLNERYIETILNLFKNGTKINISINPFEDGNSLNDVANIYIIYAKYDLVEYLPILGKDELLLKKLDNQKEKLTSKVGAFVFGENNKLTLIELLLKLDESLTIDRIITESNQRDFDVAMILRTYNFFENNLEYDLKPNSFISDLLDKINGQYNNISLSKEEEILLYNLFQSFQDCSDIKALKALINSYKIQLKKGNPNTIKEIKLLTELKRNGSPLSFKIGDNQYSTRYKTVEIRNEFTSIMNHELCHALFHNLTDERIPPEFYDIVRKVRNNKNTIRKVYEYSENEKDNRKKVHELANEKYNDAYPLMNKVIELYKVRNALGKAPNDNLERKEEELSILTYDLRKEIYDYLTLTREEKIHIYKEQGYREEDLKILFGNSFTIKEYARMHKKIQKREFISIIYSTLLAPAQSIGDIIDAIYGGNFISGNLYYDGKKINPVSGHGLFYYNYDKRTVFDEMLAGYRTIIMSEFSDIFLEELRYYVGDELVDFLDNYYNNVLLNSTIWQKKSNEERKVSL